MRPVAAAIPTGIITRLCAGPCPDVQPSDKPLTLVLITAAASPSVAWTINGAAASGSGPKLVVDPTQMPTDGSPLTITATITSNGMSGVASFIVPVNAAPVCSQEPCVKVATRNSVFPSADFAATASGFADPDGLTNALVYEWGVIGANGKRQALLIDHATSFRFMGMPVGNTTAYVRAIDAYGAAAMETFLLTVAAPGADFSAAAQVTSFNVTNTLATGDPSAINNAARTIAALAGFGLASNATDADKANFQADVDSKGAALLIASSANVVPVDPEAAQTTANSAAELLKVMTNVSADAKGAALSIANNREWQQDLGCLLAA